MCEKKEYLDCSAYSGVKGYIGYKVDHAEYERLMKLYLLPSRKFPEKKERIKKMVIDKKHLDFIRKNEKYKKYFLWDDGFTPFDFKISNDNIMIDSHNEQITDNLEINGKICHFSEYNPGKLITSGMSSGEKYLMFTRYGNMMVFVLM